IVDEPGVTPNAGPPPCRVDVCLGRYRILVVTEVIAYVGEHLDERDTQIGRIALAPIRHGDGQSIEHQLSKARVIPGEVVDVRRRKTWFRALRCGSAVEVTR